jgi:hypothetical protein
MADQVQLHLQGYREPTSDVIPAVYAVEGITGRDDPIQVTFIYEDGRHYIVPVPVNHGTAIVLEHVALENPGHG